MRPSVYSFSTLEHVRDVVTVLSETARVLRPGGVTFHVVDPWFAPGGGHSVCTLDFPWGHVRLTENELERYLGEHRPHEADEALNFYRTGFQQPRLTLAALQGAFRAAGLEPTDEHETRTSHPLHDQLADGTLADCRPREPKLERRDLIGDSYVVLASRAG